MMLQNLATGLNLLLDLSVGCTLIIYRHSAPPLVLPLSIANLDRCASRGGVARSAGVVAHTDISSRATTPSALRAATPPLEEGSGRPELKAVQFIHTAAAVTLHDIANGPTTRRPE